MNSKKFEFRDFDSIIRFAVKNESDSEKLRSRDRFFYESIGIKFVTNHFVNHAFSLIDLHIFVAKKH